jgi:hypothetical protein
MNEREKSPKASGKVMAASRTDRKSIKCHHCGKLGHIRRFCKDLNKDKNLNHLQTRDNKLERDSQFLVVKV